MPHTPCPDFDLAPLTKWSPDILSATGEDSVGSLVLALSLAFNDFKDIQWLNYQLGKCRPEVAEVSAECGQWIGMIQFVHRRLVALVHELIVAIDAGHTQGLLESPEWQSALASIQPEERECWQILVDAALDRGDPGASELRKALAIVRNSAADHYYQPKALRRGYAEHFGQRPTSPANEYAYVSLGPQLEGTRFYFADAAASQVFFTRFPKHPVGSSGASFDMFNDLQQVMNRGLRSFLESFWRARQERIEAGS